VIPVLLMLVCPGPASVGPATAPAQRASDTDRDIAADILCAAVGDGRLTLDELDERLGAALSARTIAELAALIADLPGRPRVPPRGRPADASGWPADAAAAAASAGPAASSAHAADPTGRTGAVRPAIGRWPLIQSATDARARARLPAR
jgi:hypothetical protein